MSRTGIVLVLLVLSLHTIGCSPTDPPATDDASGSAIAQPLQLELRFQGAERIVVGTVHNVSAAFGRNEYGDLLILSTITLGVQHSLRGPSPASVSFELEGGTVGAMTLEVSDLPTLRVGDHGVFALRRTHTGSWVPNRRGLGLLLGARQPDLNRLRRAEEVSR